MKLGICTVITLAFLTTNAALHATTIYNITGPSPFGFAAQDVLVEGWNQTVTYTGVDIVMPLADLTTPGPISGTEGVVYLTDQIGTGTTALANEVASVSVSGLTGSFTAITLFSGLNLGPGNYYIVLDPMNKNPMSMSPEGSSTASQILGPGVSDLGGGDAVLLAAYPPASPISITTHPSNIFITVTGTEAAVPEPSGVVLVLAAIGGIITWRRRRP